MYSVTGFKAPADPKLHGPVWPLQRRSNSTALVWSETYKRLSLTTQGNIRYRLKTPYRDGTTDVVFEPLDKIAGSDLEPPQAGPQGEGQDALSTLWPAWPPWCRHYGSTLRALMRAIRGAHPAGALRASKFTPGEFVTASLRRTIGYVNK
jgi:hypothetical protein